jgi:hypothetical protein
VVPNGSWQIVTTSAMSFYPALIDKETFEKAEAEKQHRRAKALGRLTKTK